MKIETTTHTIDIFPIRKVRISYKCDDNMEDDFHRVCQKDLIIDRENTIGMNQQQSTLVPKSDAPSQHRCSRQWQGLLYDAWQ